mgnify:CR=1 FL=1
MNKVRRGRNCCRHHWCDPGYQGWPAGQRPPGSSQLQWNSCCKRSWSSCQCSQWVASPSLSITIFREAPGDNGWEREGRAHFQSTGWWSSFLSWHTRWKWAEDEFTNKTLWSLSQGETLQIERWSWRVWSLHQRKQWEVLLLPLLSMNIDRSSSFSLYQYALHHF